MKTKAKSEKAGSSPSLMTSSDYICLLSGFGKFGGGSYNPSQETVESFPDILITQSENKANSTKRRAKEVHIEKIVLETVGKTAWKNLNSRLKKLPEDKPLVLVMTGLAEGIKGLHLERFAMNLRDYRIKDMSGAQIVDKPIIKNAQDLIRTTLPLDKLSESLGKSGIPCRVSNHAGTFICNELYFNAMHHTQDIKAVKACLFVHMPLAEEFAQVCSTSKNKKLKARAMAANTRKKQIELLRDALAEVIEGVVKTSSK